MSISIKDVGPIRSLEIPVPEGGGVIVLRGRNGAGKSHAIDAASRLLGSNSRLPVNDEAKTGSVSGLGVNVRVGGKITSKGQLEAESIEGSIDLSMLVDPGVADEEAANARRIKALVRLAGVQLTTEEIGEQLQVQDLAGDVGSIDGDLVDRTAKIKRYFDKEAKQHEKMADQQGAKASSLLHSIKSVDLTTPSDAEQLHAAVEEMSVELARLNQQRADASTASEAIARAQNEIADTDVVDVEGAEQSFATAKRELERVEEQLADTRQFLANAEADLRHARDMHERRQKLQAAIDQIVPESPTDEDVAAAEQALASARAAVDQGAIVRKAMETHVEATEYRDSAQNCANHAERMRQLAKRTEAVLSNVIQTLDTPLQVHKETLCVERPKRGMVPFSELSFGERWRIALDIGVKRVGRRGLLAIKQEAWESLDVLNRERIAAFAKECGVAVLTAECDKEEIGELRAEMYEPALEA